MVNNLFYYSASANLTTKGGKLAIKGRTSAENSRSMRGLGKGVSGKPYPRLCKTATRTRDLPVTGGKTLPLAPGPPFI